MPRRYSDFPDGYGAWNTTSSLGSVVSVVGVISFVVLVWDALSREEGFLCWHHGPEVASLEWAAPGGIAHHTYAELPWVSSPLPLVLRFVLLPHVLDMLAPAYSALSRYKARGP